MNKQFSQDIVNTVRAEFTRRARERRPLEAQWRLNSNFYLGNQYCSIAANGNIDEVERDYFWQEREVFNHIATILETRAAKLKKVRPELSVRPATGDEDDIQTAKAATKILNSTQNKLQIDTALTRGTMWSELTGSVFYKVVWDNTLGRIVDNEGNTEGDIRLDVCSPYEIYPDSLFNQDIDDCNSIIHARAVPVTDIERVYKVKVKPERTLAPSAGIAFNGGGLTVSGVASTDYCGEREDCAMVIEMYTRPTKDRPQGTYAAVCNDILLHYDTLPYLNGDDNKPSLPFVKQVSMAVCGRFFGMSPIERAIPVQRAYNAVKNRKHEFLNRMAVGVLAVEDGSVDMDNLMEEGLSPGKVLVYRQGSTPPQMMSAGSIPSDFSSEEARLLNEFTTISGVSDLMRSSTVPSAVTSGVALQLLAEQDDTRLSLTAEHIRFAARAIAKHILRLYKQFAVGARVERFVGENGLVEVVAWSSTDISSDDIVFDTENEINSSLAARQETMFQLFKMGLLSDENGKFSSSMKRRFLDSLGFGNWDSDISMAQLQTKRASNENAKFEYDISELDDHQLHIDEHIRFMLSENLKGTKADTIAEHIKQHRKYLALETAIKQSSEQNQPIALEGEVNA